VQLTTRVTEKSQIQSQRWQDIDSRAPTFRTNALRGNAKLNPTRTHLETNERPDPMRYVFQAALMAFAALCALGNVYSQTPAIDMKAWLLNDWGQPEAGITVELFPAGGSAMTMATNANGVTPPVVLQPGQPFTVALAETPVAGGILLAAR